MLSGKVAGQSDLQRAVDPYHFFSHAPVRKDFHPEKVPAYDFVCSTTFIFKKESLSK